MNRCGLKTPSRFSSPNAVIATCPSSFCSLNNCHKTRRMSAPARYSMLKQTLDDREVTKGLGGPIRLRKKCCQPWMWWTCFAVSILIGLGMSVAISIFFAMPQASRSFYQFFHQFSNSNESTPAILTTTTAAPTTDVSHSTTKYQMPVLGRKNVTKTPSLTTDNSVTQQPLYNSTEFISNSTVGNHTLNIQVLTEEAKKYLTVAYQWAEEQWVKIPKIPLLIGVSLLVLVIISVVWLVLYRRLMRRQRRRRLGKLVAQLQAEDKNHLLNSSDDTDDE